MKHYYTREIGEETVGLWKLRLDAKLNEIMPYYNQLYKSELLEFNPLYDVDLTTENNGTKTENRDMTNNESQSKNGGSTNRKDIDNETTTEVTANTTATENGSTTNEDIRKDMYSDTPQGALTNVENGEYLTNARKVNDDKTETRQNIATGENTTNTKFNDSITEGQENSYNEDIERDKTENEQINTTDKYVQTVLGKTGGTSYSKLLEEFRKTFLNIDTMVINDLSDLFMNLW